MMNFLFIDSQVAAFHKVMGIPDRDTPGVPDEQTLRLRMRLVSRAKLAPNLPEIADALGDIDYVVAGTRLQLGIKGVAVADAIHEANMNKAPGGVVIRDEFGKVRKPANWTPPDIASVLRAQGWEP